MPQNRLKLTSIDHGAGIYLGADKVKNIKLFQQTNPISSELPISTASFEFVDENGTKYTLKFGNKVPTGSGYYFVFKIKKFLFLKVLQ